MKWSPLGNLDLLIVDDDPFNRQLVVSLLEKIESIHFIEAENGKEALEVLEKHHIDMVLLDLHMPIMDGYETLKLIKHESKYDFIPVLIVTTDEQEMNKLYSLGADDFISKPFKLSELESRIYAHIEKAQYRKKYNELSANKIQKTFIESKEYEEKQQIKKVSQATEEIDSQKNYNLDFIEKSQKEIFYSMAKMLSYKNKNVDDIKIVAMLSKALSLLMGYDKEQANTIYYSTLIRQIGTFSINENAPLAYIFSEVSKEKYQKSIFAGYKLLSSAISTNFIKIAQTIILQSKEHFDGSGFPKHKKENEIHNIAYIVSITETFNALLSQKSYLNNKIHTPQETYEILKANIGQRFHPKITKLFLNHFEYFIGLRDKIIKQNL
ncbi:response regulator receiver domain protein (CheY-like) [hydrothermal vent metagenome]|uniref:Response regulator receiver domain protein (CheY-like) n=1 Tax=hydrothermal vent metagenome TaxID=652676 RepID=A0A1W1BNJ6_9ZZZZ